MAKLRISGIWKDNNNVISHYAFHTLTEDNTASRAEKVTKEDAIRIVERPGNEVITWQWNYSNAVWRDGETVHVVNGSHGKYLRSNRDNQITDNLNHLINFDWL